VRILHVIGGLAPRYGGPSAVVPEMARALAERGHHVEIFTTDIDGCHRLQVPTSRRVEWRGVPTTFFPVHWPRPYAASMGLGAALRRRVQEFDVVHVHSLFLFHTEAAGRSCRHRSVPYILRPHGVLNRYHRSQHRWRKAVHTALLGRRTIGAAAGLHFTSVMERDHAKALGLGVPAFVVPLGINTSELHRPVDAKRLFEWQPQLTGQTLITYVGRLAPKKRLDLLVDAFAKVARVHRDTHLVLAGPLDGAGSRLRTQIERLGLSTRVSLPGLVTGEHKAALLQHSRVFAMPSEDENFGVSVVEAMAVGLPVVITDGVAIHPEIAAARAGLVVPLASRALSDSIGWLLADRGRSTSMGENGRVLSQSTFAWKTLAPELEHMYDQAIGTPANRLGRMERGR
jgi:glycosyltransferase involved in cell wall biosynthesis